MEELTANPLVLPAAGGLLALLVGFGVYRIRQRKKPSGVDSSYLESRLQPDSFFGASGGQNVDTAEAAPTGSSMMYSPSQLDAGGDVDPVAEADVYLAYGRDLQAEEILKEALRINPSRVAIHSKMLEIYAKRRDVKAFEVLACEVYALAQGSGPEWEHACALGLEIDPENPMYQPGGSPPALAGQDTTLHDVPPGMANTQPFSQTGIGGSDDQNPVSNSALDLDLDFSFDADPPAPVEPAIAAVAEAQSDNSMDFRASEFAPPAEPPKAAPVAEPAADNSLSFELNASDLDLGASLSAPMPFNSTQTQLLPLPTEPAPLTDMDLAFDLPSAPAEPLDFSPPAMDLDATQAMPLTERTTKLDASSDMMSFGPSEMSLDLGPISELPPEDIPEGDPLETKLSLAAEFLAIGDMEGARSLAEEVLEQASGPLKAKATSFLAELT